MTTAEQTKLAGLEDPTFKGYLNSPNDLNATYPVGEVGWSAIVVFENDLVTPNGNLWTWQGTPTNAWVDSGISGIGGDMAKAVYDPTNVAGDAFDLDNMVEGADVDKLFFTLTERNKLSGLEEGTEYYNKTEIDAAHVLKADVTYVDTQDLLKMDKTVYDPNIVAGDAFDMDNMVEGATTKILTDVERANIAANLAAQHSHANKALLDTITDAGTGEAYLSDDGTYQDAAKAGIHNGTAIEQQDIFLVESGGLLYIDVEKAGGGDLQVYFGNDSYLLDCTTGAGAGGRARIAIPAGTATDPQRSGLYVWLNGGVPELGTQIDFALIPNEFAWIGLVVVRDAVNAGTEGPILLQRFTDAATHNDRGRLSYLGERLRQEGSKWADGVDQTVNITTQGGTLDDLHISVLAGEVYQLHRQAFPALDVAVDGVYITGLDGSGALQNYDNVVNLNAVNEYADGSAIQDGDYYNLVIYGAINKEPGQCKLFVNPSSAGYTSANAAYNDQDNLANNSVDVDLRTVAFLIARIPVQYTSANNGTLAFINTVGNPEFIDLRGNQLQLRNDSGTGEATSVDAADVDYDNGASGLTATNVQAAIDEIVEEAPTFIMGTGFSETTTAHGLTIAWAELQKALSLSAVTNHLVIKNTFRVGHNVTGVTYRCTIVVQVSCDKVSNNATIQVGIGKGGIRIAEGFAQGFVGGTNDISERSHTATFVVDISDSEEVGIFMSDSAADTHDIYSVQLSVTGFEL